jgi:hypothetical protein
MMTESTLLVLMVCRTFCTITKFLSRDLEGKLYAARKTGKAQFYPLLVLPGPTKWRLIVIAVVSQMGLGVARKIPAAIGNLRYGCRDR